MKQGAIVFAVALLLTSCNFFENRGKKAIEMCKNSKIQFAENNMFQYFGFLTAGLSQESKWVDFANSIAKDNQNSKYKWDAKETDVKGVFLVSFCDESNWGQSWEVSLDEEIVKHINSNEYLSRKYGMSRLDSDDSFKIVDVKEKTLKREKKYDYSIGKNTLGIVYIIKGFLVNNSNKNLTKADLSGSLNLIFDNKVVESKEMWESGFKRKITKSMPWKPQEKLEFYIKTEGIEEIYLQYEPEYVVFTLNVSAEDPVGFTFDKAIEEYDLKEEWSFLKKSEIEKAESTSSKPKPTANQAVTTNLSPIERVEKASESSKKLDPTKTVTTPAKSESSTTTQKAPEKPKVDQRAVMGAGGTAGKGTQPASGGAQGSSTAKGDEGDPKGTVDGRTIMGTGSGKGTNSGDGFGLDLVGWDFASRPTINDNVSTRNGRIVFKITVDDKGRVVQSVPLEYNVSSEVLAYYRQVVNQISFKSQGGTAAEFSTGKITFVIKVD